MRRSLFQKLLWGVLLLAAIELALLNSLVVGVGTAAPELRWRMAWATMAMALAVLACAFWFSRRLRQRIGRLKALVEGLVAGPAQIPLPDSPDELGALAESLGRVAAQVNDLVDKVRLEGARRDAILTGMVEGVLAVDRELRVTFCNAAFVTAFGVQGPVPAGLPVLRLDRKSVV